MQFSDFDFSQCVSGNTILKLTLGDGYICYGVYLRHDQENIFTKREKQFDCWRTPFTSLRHIALFTGSTEPDLIEIVEKLNKNN